MKKVLFSILILIVVNLSANDLKWVNEQIEAIKPPRSGIDMKELSQIKDPFVYFSNKKGKKTYKNSKIKTYTKSYKKREKTNLNNKFDLSIIMNKTARINGKWYKIGEKISGYKIVKINSYSVQLTKNKKTFLLSTRSQNRNITFKN